MCTLNNLPRRNLGKTHFHIWSDESTIVPMNLDSFLATFCCAILLYIQSFDCSLRIFFFWEAKALALPLNRITNPAFSPPVFAIHCSVASSISSPAELDLFDWKVKWATTPFVDVCSRYARRIWNQCLKTYPAIYSSPQSVTAVWFPCQIHEDMRQDKTNL